MLILQRKVGEIINIGDDIEIIFLQRKGNSIKLGIKAPANINVFRNEIYQAIKKKQVANANYGIEL